MLFEAAIKPRIHETTPAACNNTRKRACSHLSKASGHHRYSHDYIALLQTISLPRNHTSMHVHHTFVSTTQIGSQLCKLARMHRRAFLQNLVPQLLPVRYAGRHANFWQQSIEREQCKRSSASSPGVCCAHMNEVAAFTSGTTRRTEALFQDVPGQLTLSKERGSGDAGRGVV